MKLIETIGDLKKEILSDDYDEFAVSFNMTRIASPKNLAGEKRTAQFSINKEQLLNVLSLHRDDENIIANYELKYNKEENKANKVLIIYGI